MNSTATLTVEYRNGGVEAFTLTTRSAVAWADLLTSDDRVAAVHVEVTA